MNSNTVCTVREDNQRVTMCKHWKERIQSWFPTATGSSILGWVIQACWSCVGCQLANNTIYRQQNSWQEELHMMDFFLRSKHISTWTVKTVEYSLHGNPIISPIFLVKELWDHCSLKRQLLQKIIQIFYPVHCSAGTEWMGLLVKERRGGGPRCEDNGGFLAVYLLLSQYGDRYHQTLCHLTSFCGYCL
jgi:hypothetical protein